LVPGEPRVFYRVLRLALIEQSRCQTRKKTLGKHERAAHSFN
jgi:hypothetical protein